MSGQELTTEDLIDKADRLEESGDPNEALRYWRLALERAPDPVVLCRLGNVAMEMGDLSEAERAFLSAIELAPTLPNAHNMLGLLYLERGDLESALPCFLRSAEIEESKRTLTFLGTVQLQLGMTHAARESLTKALALDPNCEEASYNLGLCYRTEAPSEAISCFRRAIEIDPEYGSAHRELGWALRGIARYAEAERHLRKAIELDESDGWAYLYLGNVLWITGDSHSAEQAFQKTTRVWPDDSIPFWSLAMFYERENRPQEAEFYYESALHLNPDDPLANRRFGLFLNDIGESAKAEPFLERARNLERDG